VTDAFAFAATALTADPNLGADAVYTPPGGDPVALRTVLRREEADIASGFALRIGTGWRAMLTQAAVPTRPARGATLAVGGTTWTVEEAEADEASATWMVTLRA
jgi:hypothetical protein